MIFAAPFWLLVGLGTLVVVAFHLRRSRSVEVSSLQIWREVPQIGVSTRIRSRPPLTVPLLLQLLFVLLIALALAGPRVAASNLPEHRVVVVDASASMAAGSPLKFDRAIEHLGGRVALGESEGARVSVIYAGPIPRIVAARLADALDVMPMMEALGPSDGPTDWAAAQALVHSVVREGERTVVSIVSDGVVPLSTSSPDVTIELAVLEADIGNAALAGELVRTDEDNGWRFDGEVVTDSSNETFTVTASFQPDGVERFVELDSLAVASGSRVFSLELRVPGDGILRIALPADGVAADNAMLFTLRNSMSQQVLFIGEPQADVVLALEANKVTDISQADAVPANVGDYDLAIISDGRVNGTVATNVLWLASTTTTSAPVALPTKWDISHPLSRGVDWASVEPGSSIGVDRLPGAEVLLAVRDRTLVQARITPDGREIVIAFDPARSNWPTQSSFPVFFANLLNWIDTAPAGAHACVVGAFCDIDPRWMRATLLSPDGLSIPLEGAALAAANAGALPSGIRLGFEPAIAGLHVLMLDGRAISLAVNTVPDLIESTDAAALPNTSAPIDLAPWFLAASLIVIALETFIAGRSVGRPYRVRANERRLTRQGMVALRAFAGLAVVAAIASFPLPRTEPAENATVVLSTSQAAGSGAGATTALVEEAGWRDRTGFVAFGVPVVRVDIGEEDREQAASPDRGAVGGVGGVALAMLPRVASGRIIVAGDDVEAIADIVPSAIARGVPIDILIPGDDERLDVAVGLVDLPPQPRAGEAIELLAVVYASAATDAQLTVYRDDEVVVQRTVSLLKGTNRIEVELGEADLGTYLYEVAVVAEGDAVPQNNRAGMVLGVEGPTRVMIMSSEPERTEAFADALAVHGIEVAIGTADAAENYAERWLDYDVIALDNVPAIDLTTLQQEALAEAVSVHGRGVLLLGGPNSFGPGGYYRTPLEDISPISSRVPRDAPKAVMVFVLDRSGSMQQLSGTTTRLDIAKEATLEAIALLHEDSEVAVIVFDSEAQTVVPLQPAANADALREAITPIEPGGGTNIYPGLVLALEQFENADAANRHVVVLTDGLSQRGDFDGIAASLREMDVTVSTVAIGEGAERPLLEAIARNGGGAFHATTDFRALPSILSQEAMMLSGSPIEERIAWPGWVERPRWMATDLFDDLPPVEGYVLTTARDAADTHLTVEDAEGGDVPLLASWRYGNGFVAAFTSHAVGPWSEDWYSMPEFALLWAQLIREASPQTRDGAVLSVERESDTLVAQVAGVAGSEPIRGTIAGPDEAAGPWEVSFVEDEGNRMTAANRITFPGTYVISATVGDTVLEARHHVSYLAAYAPPTPGQIELQSAVAEATGGRVVSDPALLFGDPTLRWVMEGVSRPWAFAALLAILVELALRYGRTYGSRSAQPETRTNDNTIRAAA